MTQLQSCGATISEFEWLIRTSMYAIAGCALIAKGGAVFLFIGVGLVFLAVFYSNLVLSVKLRDDILLKLEEKTAN